MDTHILPCYFQKMLQVTANIEYTLSNTPCQACELPHTTKRTKAAGQVPNFRTINSFRLRRLEHLPGLFTQIVYLCGSLGLIGFEYLTIDGQKIEANDSFREEQKSEAGKEGVRKNKAGIGKTAEQRGKRSVTRREENTPRKRRGRQLQELESFQKELKQLEDEDARLNMTDRDTKVMRHKDGTGTPGHTHQSAVDDAYGVIAPVQTTLMERLPGRSAAAGISVDSEIQK